MCFFNTVEVQNGTKRSIGCYIVGDTIKTDKIKPKGVRSGSVWTIEYIRVKVDQNMT